MPDHAREARALINEKGRLGARVELRLREVAALERLAAAQETIATESRVQSEILARSLGAHVPSGGRWIRDDGWEVTQDLGRPTWGVLTPGGDRWLLTSSARDRGLTGDVWGCSASARADVDVLICPIGVDGLAVGWRHEPLDIGL
jgi:hypothetical protein